MAVSVYADGFSNVKNFKTVNKSNSSKKLVAMFLALFAFLSIALTFVGTNRAFAAPTPSPASNSNSSNGLLNHVLCSSPDTLGYNMEQHPWKSPLVAYPNSSSINRKWSGNEIVGYNTMVVAYEGEGSGDSDMIVDVGDKRGEGIGNFNDKLSDLKAIRNNQNCYPLSTIGYKLANTNFYLATAITSLTTLMVTEAFNPHLICSDQYRTNCLDFIGFIGGHQGTQDHGIIGVLTNGIYMPLLILVVMVAAGRIAYTGFRKGQIRQALFQFVWVIASVLLGLIFLLNPWLIARAPMAVTNTIAACSLGAMSGDNCFVNSDTSNATGGLSDTTDNLCKSEAAVAPDEKLTMMMNGFSCGVWKAFVLEPYTEAMFGRSFNQMDTSDDTTKKAISAAGLSPGQFCVNMTSSDPVDYQGDAINLDSSYGQICNVAFYQLYLETKAQSNNDPIATGLDKRWYNVILVAANDPNMWSHWPKTQIANQSMMPLMSMTALFCSIIGGVVLIVTAFFALMFLIISIMLTAFAPLFFLIGVDPGRGRKILLGYAEMLISNLLKYFASSLFLVVTLAFYQAVLKNINNVGLTLILILLVSGALLMYRRELVNMMGHVSMGGDNVANRLGETMSKRVKHIGGEGRNLALAATGSAAGALVAGGNMNDVVSGAKDGTLRELRRGRTFVSNVAREANRISTDNKDKFDRKLNEAKHNVEIQSKNYNAVQSDVMLSSKGANDAMVDSDRAKARFEETLNKESEISKIEGQVMATIKIDDNMKELLELQSKMRALDTQAIIARQAGDNEKAKELEDQKASLSNRVKEIQESEDFDMSEFNAKKNEFNSMVRERIEASADSESLNEYLNSRDEILKDAAQDYANALVNERNAVDIHNKFVEQNREIKAELEGETAKYKTAEELRNQEFRPGNTFRTQESRKFIAQMEAAGDKAKTDSNSANQIKNDPTRQFKELRVSKDDFGNISDSVSESIRSYENQSPILDKASTDNVNDEEAPIETNGNVSLPDVNDVVNRDIARENRERLVSDKLDPTNRENISAGFEDESLKNEPSIDRSHLSENYINPEANREMGRRPDVVKDKLNEEAAADNKKDTIAADIKPSVSEPVNQLPDLDEVKQSSIDSPSETVNSSKNNNDRLIEEVKNSRSESLNKDRTSINNSEPDTFSHPETRNDLSRERNDLKDRTFKGENRTPDAGKVSQIKASDAENNLKSEPLASSRETDKISETVSILRENTVPTNNESSETAEQRKAPSPFEENRVNNSSMANEQERRMPNMNSSLNSDRANQRPTPLNDPSPAPEVRREQNTSFNSEVNRANSSTAINRDAVTPSNKGNAQSDQNRISENFTNVSPSSVNNNKQNSEINREKQNDKTTEERIAEKPRATEQRDSNFNVNNSLNESNSQNKPTFDATLNKQFMENKSNSSASELQEKKIENINPPRQEEIRTSTNNEANRQPQERNFFNASEKQQPKESINKTTSNNDRQNNDRGASSFAPIRNSSQEEPKRASSTSDSERATIAQPKQQSSEQSKPNDKAKEAKPTEVKVNEQPIRNINPSNEVPKESQKPQVNKTPTVNPERKPQEEKRVDSQKVNEPQVRMNVEKKTPSQNEQRTSTPNSPSSQRDTFTVNRREEVRKSDNNNSLPDINSNEERGKSKERNNLSDIFSIKPVKKNEPQDNSISPINSIYNRSFGSDSRKDNIRNQVNGGQTNNTEPIQPINRAPGDSTRESNSQDENKISPIAPPSDNIIDNN